MSEEIYDVIIIGGGPAGLTAGIYAARGLLKTLIIERLQYGGQAVMTHEIENYPGAGEKETGISLIEKMMEQAEGFGAQLISDEITEANLTDEIKVLKSRKKTYKAKTIIIATGAHPRTLGCPGEQELTGRGVSYCATCDAAFFTGLEVYIVGGGDSAVQEAIFISKFARKITFIQNLPELTAAKSLRQKVLDDPKYSFVYNSIVEELKSESGDLLDTIIVKNTQTGETTEFKADPTDETFGMFVFIGLVPCTDIFEGQITMENGYIKTNESMLTNIPGVYAVGDCRTKPLRQIVTATNDGAIAAMQAEHYLSNG